MANILIVGQKELISAPIFKQDKNMLALYNSLKDTNNVEILFLHKDMKLNEQLEEGNVDTKQESKKIEKNILNVKQFCIRDLMKNRLFKKNLNNFINEHKIEVIIFMSNHMAKLVMPYIESLLTKLNVICDLRLTNISYYLQQYKYEKEKDEPNFHGIYKNFKIHFIQLLPILMYTNNIILDEDCDTHLFKKQNVNNMILAGQVKDYVKNDNIVKNKDQKYKLLEIIINRNNYSSNIESKSNIQSRENTNRYIINETKKFNLIDDINSVIKRNKSDYIAIYNDKIKILPNTLDLIIKYLSFNDNLVLSSPLVYYPRERNNLKTQFENQKLNNFSNWSEDKPLSFSECVIIKKKFFNKIGLFDNSFKTFDYALFDFILKLYQIKAYYCTMNDISVFKAMNVSRQISLFKEDKKLLCKKWGESLFDIGI